MQWQWNSFIQTQRRVSLFSEKSGSTFAKFEWTAPLQAQQNGELQSDSADIPLLGWNRLWVTRGICCGLLVFGDICDLTSLSQTIAYSVHHGALCTATSAWVLACALNCFMRLHQV